MTDFGMNAPCFLPIN